MLLNKFWLTLLSFFIFVNYATAKPFVPNSQNEVIQVFEVVDGIKKINELRDELLVNEKNYTALDEVIKLYLKLGRKKSDPRYFGYAQALLEPYLSVNNLESDYLPENIKIHWADILQHRHDFEQALHVLNSLARKNTKNPQVYLMRANIYLSRGNYEKALKNCKMLISRASHLISISCVAQVKSLTGNLQQSFYLLQSTLERNQQSDAEERIWALSLLGDMAMRSGKYEIAEKYYKQGLKINNEDFYILANYADLLLNQKQYIRVINLLDNYSYVDSLLLRLTIANIKLNSQLSEQYISQLEANVKLIELRGDKAHLRDQARFYFEVLSDNKKAMKFAQQNWLIQKEPADAKLLLNVAIEINNKVQIDKIKLWVSMRSLQDVEMNRSLMKAAKL